MAVTRLKRKSFRNKRKSTWRKNVLKHLTAVPVVPKKKEGDA